MSFALIKIFVSALLIALISELSRRSPLWSGLLASLPLISVLSLIWMHQQGQGSPELSQFCTSVFWLVLPSLILFLLLPVLLKNNVAFYPALLLACVATALGYWALVKLLQIP